VGASDSTISSRLRVAIVAPTLAILGGHSVQADVLIRRWRDDPDVEATLLPINPHGGRLLATAQRIKYVRTGVTQLLYWPSLVRAIREADLVHVFSASYSSFVLSVWPAVRVARALRKPVLLNYHSGHAHDHLMRSALARRTLGRVRLNVVPSRFLQEVFRRFNLDALVIPNVVEVDRFQFAARTPLRPRLLSTRNLEPDYNVACTLRAFHVVQDRYPEASLTIVGSGSEDGELRTLAGTLRLRNVTFTGRVPSDRIERCYADGDIYIQSPNADNMPISVLEAWASGLPLVSTEAGGIPALVIHGETGLLAPLNDHAALADRVIRLLDDPDAAREMARRGRQAVEAFTWPRVRASWLQAYQSLAAAPGLARDAVRAQ
jgi:glycosyltransferase involved in cell wall biosynthesis